MQGVYKSSLINFQDTFNKVPGGFLHIGYKYMHFQLCTMLWINLHKNGQIFGSLRPLPYLVQWLAYYRILADNTFSRSINKIRDFQDFLEWFQIPRDFHDFDEFGDALQCPFNFKTIQ